MTVAVEKSAAKNSALQSFGMQLAHLRERAWQTLSAPFYDIYTHKLRAEMQHWRKPRHVGIVMDGNRRFARLLGTDSVIDGHQKGADKLDEVLTFCERAGIRVVSVWGFSLDNFKRAPEEVDGLMNLFEQKFLELVTSERIHRDQVQVRSFGRLELLPEKVQRAIAEAEKATAHYTRRILNVGIAYGGREEIVDAFSSYLRAEAKAGRTLEDICDKLSTTSIDPHMYSAQLPDPDLIIRTSGEVRLSGFLLWQSAYSEYYFCDVHWPAFRELDFLRALRAYHQRQRRFGI